MAWLLDTNVLSELRKGRRADARVLAWAATTLKDRHFISVLALGEIRKGIELLRTKSPSQCPAFERWLAQLQADYAEEILPVSEEIAERWGRLMAIRTLPAVDGIIAATAAVHGLTIATRNVADFKLPGIRVVDPFG
ncbi:MAG TPA: type II toxin-antitoxin system VapC family toxin [Terriglobia bacterium]|nr:type II toxin-antitoxin system VapC family toxin [Terriglobia bacterium]